MKFYKIWDTEKQLFFKGGQSNTEYDYSKNGKTWNEMRHVKACLRGHCENLFNRELWKKGIYETEWFNNIPETWEVIEYSTEGERRFKAKDFYPNEIPS